MQRPRIFVHIACYRDPECQWTVKDLFATATHPERVFVGILWQSIEAEDAHCFVEPSPRPAQMRVRHVDARESRGACWARAETSALWQGEEWALQIDSHMRFEPGWDELLLSMVAAVPSEKAIISTYPSGYLPPDTRRRESMFAMGAKEFRPDGILLMQGRFIAPAAAPAKPLPGAFISGAFCFGPSAWLREVPYDPHLYFFGEEISMAVRLWTHGYDIYHPHRQVLYHLWSREGRRTHFDDHSTWRAADARAVARIHHIFGLMPSTDVTVTVEAERYGLGTARNLAEYEAWAGIDFMARTFTDLARDGRRYPLTPAAAAAAARMASEG
jgi:hypothetical protein